MEHSRSCNSQTWYAHTLPLRLHVPHTLTPFCCFSHGHVFTLAHTYSPCTRLIFTCTRIRPPTLTPLSTMEKEQQKTLCLCKSKRQYWMLRNLTWWSWLVKPLSCLCHTSQQNTTADSIFSHSRFFSGDQVTWSVVMVWETGRREEGREEEEWGEKKEEEEEGAEERSWEMRKEKRRKQEKRREVEVRWTK